MQSYDTTHPPYVSVDVGKNAYRFEACISPQLEAAVDNRPPAPMLSEDT
jgi:hypothetical protein